jgi:NADH-quinone oxidoreductase subunit N
VIVGLGFKVAVVPFHAWAPDVYEGAPTPVVAFIATGSKVASFVVAGKIVLVGFAGLAGSARWSVTEGPQAGWTFMLAMLAVASMVWGNVAAIAQKNVKRLLAYSSIAHAGYILIAIIATNHMGVVSVLYYLIAYSLANLGAFGVVAVLTRAAGGDDLEDFDGMAQRAPLLSLLLLIFVLSLAGIPPLAGFFGKLFLFAAAVQADPQNLGLLWLVVIGVATSAVSLYYYLALLKRVYVLPPREGRGPVHSPALARVTLAVTALAVVAVGVFPQPFVQGIGELLPRTVFVFKG